MKILIENLHGDAGTLYVICESWYLINALHRNLSEKGDPDIRCIRTSSPSTGTSILSSLARIKVRAFFTTRYLLRILLAKTMRIFKNSTSAPRRDRKAVVINSWADGRSFLVPDIYTDSYFGNLGERITNTGAFCFPFVTILPTYFYLAAVMRLSGIRSPHVLLEECLAFSDVIHALRESPVVNGPGQTLVLSGLDVTDLVREDMERDRISSRPAQAYLSYAAARTLCRHYAVQSCVYTFENHMWEKMFIRGIREAAEKTAAIGYAHASVNRMELSYSCSEYERGILPQPDRILVNGTRSKETLAGSGFEKDRILISGSLRYEYLFNRETRQGNTGKRTILVVLSADYHRSIEMIHTCCRAFGSAKDSAVIFKPHPTLDPALFTRSIIRLPAHISFSTAPIRDLFEDAGIVLYNDSSAAVEAAVLGIPLFHIKSAHTIDINIFDSEPSVPSSGDPEIIRSCVADFFSKPPCLRTDLQELVRDYYAPVDDAILFQAIR
jgi:hypothetical protein